MPLGIIGLFFALRLVPDVRATERRRLDWRGFLLTAFGVAALVIGLEQIGTGRLNWAFIAIALGTAAAGAGGGHRLSAALPAPAAGPAHPARSTACGRRWPAAPCFGW